MSKISNAYMMTAALSASLFLSGGCWQFTLKPVQAPYVTRQAPYVAILQFPYEQNEEVVEVLIHNKIGSDRDRAYGSETCWRIKAVASIAAEGFAVEIGKVPRGFRQLVPQDGQSFAPIVGSKYVVHIKTTNSRASYCGWWRAGAE